MNAERLHEERKYGNQLGKLPPIQGTVNAMRYCGCRGGVAPTDAPLDLPEKPVLLLALRSGAAKGIDASKASPLCARDGRC